MKALSLIKFKDAKENLSESFNKSRYGILLEDNTVICFCCGGTIPLEDCIIIEKDIPWHYLEESAEKGLVL